MIERYDVHEDWAHTGIIKAGDFCFLNYCVGNVGGTVEQQINGAFDEMERRLALVGLTLQNVVQMDCLFRDVWNIVHPVSVRRLFMNASRFAYYRYSYTGLVR